jgi:oxaloacetate decarboxylase beta subunit
MSARVVQREGQKYNKKSYLLMHAMGANAGGQVGSVLAAAVMLSVLKGWVSFKIRISYRLE